MNLETQEIPDKISFQLQKPIKVQLTNEAGKGFFADIDTIYLTAPTPQQRDRTRVLKKKFFEAIYSLGNSQNKKEEAIKEDDKPLDSAAIKSILYFSKDWDIVAFFNLFQSLLIDVAFKDEDTTKKLNSLDIQSINDKDFDNLVGKYLEVFFMSSWMETFK